MASRPDTAAERVRAQQKAHWDRVAGGWGAWLEWTERSFAPLSAWLRVAAAWEPGHRVLDVGCGAGYPALAAARAVGPSGRVTAVDLSPAMCLAAADRARAAGLTNVDVHVMDAAALAFDGGSFDAVTSTYGLMFCPDPARAVAEAHRVLAPGGCAAFVVWDEPARNPFFTLMLSTAAPLLGLVPPAPDAPAPFRLADPRRLRDMVSVGGFGDVDVVSVPMTLECASVDEYCRLFADVALTARIAALSLDDRLRFRAAVADAAAPHVVSGRVRLDAASLCAIGRKRDYARFAGATDGGPAAG